MSARLLLLLCVPTQSFRIAVAGAHGSLGREIVKQSLERKWSVNALTRRKDPIYEPTRKGLLSEDTMIRIPLRHESLHHQLYTDDTSSAYDALVLCMSGRPFAPDDTTPVVNQLVSTLPRECTKVCLVSAFGVGDSLPRADVGIQGMTSWYLKSTYDAKEIQEQIVSSLPPSVDVLILRPRVLSYERIWWNPISTARQDLARTILDWTCK